jgi:formylglycine-generating enzyme required for sulfatase activity
VHAQEAEDASTPAAQPDTFVYLPVVGRAPTLANVTPAPGAQAQSLNSFLAWQLLDSSLPDPRYTVLLEAGDDTPDVVVATNLLAPNFDPVTFELDTTYYWQIVVAGSNGMQVSGPISSFRTEPLYPTPAIGTLVEVPAGEFIMGCDANNQGGTFWCDTWEQPLHRVYLDRFAIDKYEVTNVEYRACVAAGVCDAPRRSISHERAQYYNEAAFNLYPVIFVSRANAMDYCGWVGKRLPTEAEWEKAARGPIDTRPFPWGGEYTDCTRQHRPDPALCTGPQLEDTARVGLYPRGTTPYGAYDMAGNVFEWVQDVFQPDWYSVSPYRNPVNLPTNTKDFTVIRGGSYRDRYSYLRTMHRHTGHHGDYPYHDAPNYRSDRVGFRCAMSLP